MKSKTSFFNKGILSNDLKRFSWIGLVYLLVLLFVVPLKIIMLNNTNKSQNCSYSMKFIFNFDSSLIQKMLIIIIPVLTAVMLFRYIHSKKSADMIHSLPIKREKLYDNHILAGTILLISPVIITAFVSLFLKVVLNLNNSTIHYSVKNVLVWAGVTILFNILIFLFSVLIGVLTGLSTAQGILTYIFLFLPYGLSLLILYNIKIFMYGLSLRYSNSAFAAYSPLVKILDLHLVDYYYSPYMLYLPELILYLIASIIIFFLARFIYMKRHSEAASKTVAFTALQPILKYGVTFCSMLVGGLYFARSQHNIYWTFFGYITASLIGYFIAEIIIQKSFKVFKNIKGYLIFGAVTTVIFLCINFNITSFENRIPPLENIECVYLNHGFLMLDDVNLSDVTYSSNENITNVRKFHQAIINNKNFLRKNRHYKGHLSSFQYIFKNGKTLKRQYYVPVEMYAKYFKPIYESKEHKTMNFKFLSNKHSDFDKITITSRNLNKKTVILDPIDIKEVVELLQEDKLNETYEESQSIIEPWGDITLLLADAAMPSDSSSKSSSENKRDDKILLSLKKHYTKFEKWLKEKGYLENSRIMPEDIKYAVVEELNSSNSFGEELNLKDKTIKRLDIYDKSKLETCLRNYSYQHPQNPYIIGFYLENGDVFYKRFDKKNVPDFVREYFAE